MEVDLRSRGEVVIELALTARTVSLGDSARELDGNVEYVDKTGAVVVILPFNESLDFCGGCGGLERHEVGLR
jgi:hypothetical protein